PADLISSILKDTPVSVTRLNAALPRELGRVVRRCLEKDPGQRYQSARDIRNELEDLERDIESGEISPAAGSVRGAARRRRWLLPLAAGVWLIAGAALGALLGRGQNARNGGASRVKATFTRITSGPAVEAAPSLSPDGRTVAFQSNAAGNRDIF